MLVMVPTLLSTLADQAHNTTSGQFTMFHEIHQQNLKVVHAEMRQKYSKVPHTFRKLKKRIFFFVC